MTGRFDEATAVLEEAIGTPRRRPRRRGAAALVRLLVRLRTGARRLAPGHGRAGDRGDDLDLRAGRRRGGARDGMAPPRLGGGDGMPVRRRRRGLTTRDRARAGGRATSVRSGARPRRTPPRPRSGRRSSTRRSTGARRRWSRRRATASPRGTSSRCWRASTRCRAQFDHARMARGARAGRSSRSSGSQMETARARDGDAGAIERLAGNLEAGRARAPVGLRRARRRRREVLALDRGRIPRPDAARAGGVGRGERLLRSEP